MQLNRNFAFWKGKKVFLTGHTGFKGCWLFMWLQMLGAEVFGYSLPPLKPSMYGTIFPNGEENGVFADICDNGRLESELVTFNPDVVFHMATQPVVRRSYRQPLLTWDVNIGGTVNLLSAAKVSSWTKSIVVVTSDKVYRNKDKNRDEAHGEGDALGGLDPCSCSNACVELICDSWRHSYLSDGKQLLATARTGHVLGGGDWGEDRLLPDAVRAFAANQALMVRAPNAVRPWQHILDPLCGYLTLARKLYEGHADYASAWNFGPPDKDYGKVSDIAKKLVVTWGENVSYIISPEKDDPWDADERAIYAGKAMRKLSWTPILNTRTALQMAVDWYKAVGDRASARTVTEKQISDYMVMLWQDLRKH